MIEDMQRITGLRVISLGENGGFRSFTNNKRRVKVATDMAGLKIRTMNSPLHMDIVRNLGGIPTPLGISELYTALQTGACDGQENAPAVTQVWHFEEVQKYYTLDKHVYSITTFLINNRFYQGLSEDLRAAVDKAGMNATIAMRKACVEREDGILNAMRSKGMDIYEPTPEEFKTFQLATQQPALDFLYKNIDRKWVDGMIELVKQKKE
jgi:C4-dicarboxylate-binding protein DctP